MQPFPFQCNVDMSNIEESIFLNTVFFDALKTNYEQHIVNAFMKKFANTLRFPYHNSLISVCQQYGFPLNVRTNWI